jgi:hypothetical protein
MGSFAEGEQEKFTICSARYKAIYLQFWPGWAPSSSRCNEIVIIHATSLSRHNWIVEGVRDVQLDIYIPILNSAALVNCNLLWMWILCVMGLSMKCYFGNLKWYTSKKETEGTQKIIATFTNSTCLVNGVDD